MIAVKSKNYKTLETLLATNQIHVHRGKVFVLEVPPKPAEFDFGKVKGMLLGIAIGDSLGNTSESMRPSDRREKYGEIRDYLFNRHIKDTKGIPSDDTQLTFWTLEQIITDGEFIPENVATRFTKDRIFGIGKTVREFLGRLEAGSLWYLAGPKFAGNGALMRIAPMLIPHLRNGGTDIWADTALSAMLTHNDASSISACIAFIAMLWDLLDMNQPPEKEWWVNRFVEVAQDLEGDTHYAPRGGIFKDYCGPLWRFVQEKVPWAVSESLSVLEAGQAWYSGAFLLETVPSVLHILTLYADDPEEAIIRAVNDTRDNDTIAAIVGAAVGALHGRDALPSRWIANLTGRTSESDDGKVFDLIESAHLRFWEEGAVGQTK